MTKKVLVSITSIQNNGAETYPIQSLVQGSYSYVQNKHVICYDEILEEALGSEPAMTSCILKITPDSISLTKHGQADTEMYFKQGETFNGVYDTPFGSLQMCLRTSQLEVKESTNSIHVELSYGLDFNCSHMNDCRLKIDIRNC